MMIFILSKMKKKNINYDKILENEKNKLDKAFSKILNLN